MVEKGMAAESSNPYPPPLAAYQEVASSRELFLDTLKKLHVAMGTKFMIPIVGGKDLDLHRLFVEVTSRGGITKVVRDRKWKEVTAVFSFPSSATNASFILRKYYSSLLYHYEQIYFFKAECWTPLSTGVLQPQNKQASPLQIINTETSLSTDAFPNVSPITATPHGLAESILPPQKQDASPQQIINTSMSFPEGNETSFDKSNLEGSRKVNEDFEIGASFRAEMENKNENLENSKNEEASGLQTQQDVVGCEDNSPGHGQIVSNAVPVHQFLPMADAGFMDLDVTVQTEGNTSAYEKSSANCNLEGYEKTDEDLVMGTTFQLELELENENVEISPNGETTALQMGRGTVGCEAKNPGLGGMEEEEDDVSIPVGEGEVDPINTSESVAINKGHESP
ncbi:unnamed protein product [Fraxinus pennsylvanica]|uniref:ARID domain-containing protein n=1 Tax=Fraxinus pennsylvanica TaxID=56036 RepID=A0AAD1Z4Q8_9LAMI|nr:unnamed protein product [Fraxinus pennsylvanica]